MTMRISLQAIADHLENNLSVPGESISIGTAYDRRYISDYEKLFPAIWVAGQRVDPVSRLQGSSDNQSLSGLVRQNLKIIVPIRIVVQRYESGVVDIETSLSDIHDELIENMVGWKHPEATRHFLLEKSEDGPATESLLVADVYFSAERRFARNI